MSRSRSKTKAIKLGGRRLSDKEDKRSTNRKFRRNTRQVLKKNEEGELPNSVKDVSDTWRFNSDGLAVYMKNLPEKYMRK